MGGNEPGFPYFEHAHHGWLPHLIVPVLFLALIGVIVWAVLYVTSHRAPAPAGAAAVPARDPAMEELRIRYARGELDHDDFVRRAAELSGGAPAPGARPGPSQDG